MTWLKAEALRRGWGEPEWLFSNDEGQPHDEARVRKVFKRSLRKAKLPAFASTIFVTPSRHCSWRRARRSRK